MDTRQVSTQQRLHALVLVLNRRHNNVTARWRETSSYRVFQKAVRLRVRLDQARWELKEELDRVRRSKR